MIAPMSLDATGEIELLRAARAHRDAVGGPVTEDDSDIRRNRRAARELEEALAACRRRGELWQAADGWLRARRQPGGQAGHDEMIKAAEAHFEAALAGAA